MQAINHSIYRSINFSKPAVLWKYPAPARRAPGQLYIQISPSFSRLYQCRHFYCRRHYQRTGRQAAEQRCQPVWPLADRGVSAERRSLRPSPRRTERRPAGIVGFAHRSCWKRWPQMGFVLRRPMQPLLLFGQLSLGRIRSDTADHTWKDEKHFGVKNLTRNSMTCSDNISTEKRKQRIQYNTHTSPSINQSINRSLYTNQSQLTFRSKR